MGMGQSTQTRQEERGAEDEKAEPEAKEVGGGFFTSDDEAEELQVAQEEKDINEVVQPITTPHVGGNLRIWDTPAPSGTLVRVPGGGVRAGSHVIVPGGGHAAASEEVCTYLYVIRSGESSVSTMAELVGGRCSSAVLTAQGQRQARALGLFFLSHGLRFDALLTSPLERCKQTALSVCQEINFSQERLEFKEALVEMNQGLWEGLRKSEVYNGDIVDIMANLNKDFHAPGGESQRQVEFRMVEFVNNFVLTRSLELSLHKDTRHYYAKHEMEVPLSNVYTPSQRRNSNALVIGKAKSRIHITPPTQPHIGLNSLKGDATFDQKVPTYHVAVFSHEMAIKCLLCGLMGFPPHTIDRLCIDHTSVTLLRHSTIFGWKIMHVNDTSHLRSI